MGGWAARRVLLAPVERIEPRAKEAESRDRRKPAVGRFRLNRRRRRPRAHTPRERAPRVGWGRAQGPEGGRAGGRKGGREGTRVLKAGGLAGRRADAQERCAIGGATVRQGATCGGCVACGGARARRHASFVVVVCSRGGSFRERGGLFFWVERLDSAGESAAGCGVLAPVGIRGRRVGVADDAPRQLRQTRRFS